MKNYSPTQEWPPKEWQPIFEKYEEHAALYSGDAQVLTDYYTSKPYSPIRNGRFWGRIYGDEISMKLRVPVAADLAATSAGLLFSKPITASIKEASENKAEAVVTEDILYDMLQSTDFHSMLLEAAEYSSALGGVYIKINWDITLSPYPIPSIAQADTAIPEFKFGKLSAVTFWKNVHEDGKTIYRLLERHEPGYIFNSLYKGSETMLGERISLETFTETSGMPEEIATQIDSLLCRYIPNTKPNRLFRGANIGQSDFAGTEDLMDALDNVYSSWMRDINLAKARIIVPEEWLMPTQSGGYFDVEREVYTSLDIDPTSMENVGITMNQFAIRTDEHRQTALELLDRIITHAGYSPQSFGLQIEGRAESGTALNIRERKTFATREKKIGYWKAALEDLLYIMLEVYSIHLGGNVTSFKPVVSFTPAHIDIESLADTINTLDSASATSTYIKVKMLHPEWTEDMIQEEVARIEKKTNSIL
ncbi:phage portal protein [Lysinibacillus irui]|uniref:Phage portal protein n=1 Tax=Lysinibacillus irui TaxID=2998077 RepID=A0ABU5NJE8_9BACI|nr:phage portal protein [Lysinibacillus irui]MEA0553770.1 phage portal protein [Lysinibacillus irui]MEA0976154.1 phage portal protein [Lysinibacillus irui]MEA1042308.1 phage portal protein [Lysinibacillus irui]